MRRNRHSRRETGRCSGFERRPTTGFSTTVRPWFFLQGNAVLWGLDFAPKIPAHHSVPCPYKVVVSSPKAVSPLRGHREPCFFALFLVIASLSFRPFLGHCDPVFSPFPRSLRASFVRLAKQSQIASLRSQRRKMPPDCFAALAVTPTLSLRARSFVCKAVSPQRFLAASRLGMTDEECHCEIVFFVSEAVSLFRLLGGHCELVFTFAKQSLPLSPWGNTVEIRDCFASLAVTPFCVPARSSCRFRSSLLSYPVEIRDCFASLAVTGKGARSDGEGSSR
jgi:hypothetical protein